MSLASHVGEITKRLKKLYPDVAVELNYANAFELMNASTLAAQNRDSTINKITAVLLRKYKTPQDYIDAPIEELEADLTVIDGEMSRAGSYLILQCSFASSILCFKSAFSDSISEVVNRSKPVDVSCFSFVKVSEGACCFTCSLICSKDNGRFNIFATSKQASLFSFVIKPLDFSLARYDSLADISCSAIVYFSLPYEGRGRRFEPRREYQMKKASKNGRLFQ